MANRLSILKLEPVKSFNNFGSILAAIKNRLCVGRQMFRKTPGYASINGQILQKYSDTSKTDTSSKQIAVQGAENERVRVRRARPGDVPRMLRFVRENAHAAWPGLTAPPSTSNLLLSDYVARALAQGHSMLAEQQETRRGWSQIRGLALGLCVCPWDATILEKWARCMRCQRSRSFMQFTAHCLRAPALHDKYKVHNIMQVILIVPLNNPKSTEIIQVLAKNAIQRGRDVGFPLLRFDVTDNSVAKSLDDINLKKEWQMSYSELKPEIFEPKTTNISSIEGVKTEPEQTKRKPGINEHFVAVYTATTHDVNKSINNVKD